MIDKRFTGRALEPFTTAVPRARVSRFATAIGDDTPAFHGLAEARAAGHPEVPLPPTMLFGLEIENRGDGYLVEMGVDPAKVLHVEQRFTYHAQAYADEELAFDAVIADVYTRRDLDFVVQDSTVHRGGELVAELHQVITAGTL